MHRQRENGFTIVEALVASAVVLIVVLGVVAGFTSTLRASTGITARIQASFLEEEGQEVIRILRDNSWSTNIAGKTVGTPFYLTFNGSTWESTTTAEYIDGKFFRSVTLQSVNRDDSTQDIVTSGGTLDANIKRVIVTVSWFDHGATTTRSLETYLTDIFSN